MTTRTVRLLFPFCAFFALVDSATGAPAAPARPTVSAAAKATPDAAFEALVDTYYGEYPALYPTEATALGLHTHDGELEDLTPAGVAKELAWLKGWEARFAAVPAAPLSPDNRIDRELVLASLRSALFDLTELRPHRRWPDRYTRLASEAVNGLIKRDFATPAARLRSVVSRCERIPAMLKAGLANLDQTSQVSIDITLRNLESTAEFFERDVASAFPSVTDAAQVAALKDATATAARALREYGTALKSKRAQVGTTFALGPELYKKMLWTHEMIDEPLEPLLARGEAELTRLRKEFIEVAGRIDKTRPAADVQLAMQKDHPTSEKVIPEIHGGLSRLKQFLKDKSILTVPSDVLPLVRETPPFMRATTLAAMDTPGPFENTTEAYYYATLPEPSWPEGKREDFMRGAYSRPTIEVLSIHEAYPGHYTQFLWLPRLSKARKFTGVMSNEEGWAHYTEQMLLDAGYGAGDEKLRLAQLQDALLRAGRYVAAIRLHVKGMTPEQAADFFVRDALQTREIAEVEARRGTQDPMYLSYTYGKLEILRLQKDYQKKLGPAFTLKKFHDTLLGYGRAPLRLVRAAMLDEK